MKKKDTINLVCNEIQMSKSREVINKINFAQFDFSRFVKLE